MSRLLANCSTTTTSSASGSVITICDCECEGCCCQHLIFSARYGGEIWVDFTWSFPQTGGLLECLGLSDSYIDRVDAYYEFCPPYPNDFVIPADLEFFLGNNPPLRNPPPIIIPAASGYDCITLIFIDGSGNERTRCTVKLDP